MRQYRKLKLILIVPGVLILGFYFYLQTSYYPPILMYHHIDKNIAEANTISVSPDIFKKQLAFIKKHKYNVVSLEELCRMLKEGKRLSHNLVVITFDDGYKDNLLAVESLKQYNLPATIFIVVNWIGKQNYLTKEDLNWIVKNSYVSLGSHTLNHSYLPEISNEELIKEISGSKQKAKEGLGKDLLTLAYPVGGFTSDTIKELRQAGYLCACTTNRGFSRRLDVNALRRIKITDRDLGVSLWAKLTGFYTLFKKPRPPH